MDEARITITLNPRMIERGIYWILIIILALLLVLCYLNDTTPGEEEDAAAGVTAGLEQSVDEEETDPAIEQPSCNDNILNQDETDIDCGGSCGGCLTGESCDTAADCAGNYCIEGQCTDEEPVELSGEVSISVQNVQTSSNDVTGAVRIEQISYEIENGLEDDLNFAQARIFLTSKTDSDYCLNQQQGEERDCPQPYATFTVPNVDSSQTRQFTQDLEEDYTGGSYVQNFGTTTYYDHGDDFNLFIYLYDEAGQLIGGREVSAFRTING